MAVKHAESVFLLVNPGSGGKKGDEILRRLPDSFEVNLHHGAAAVLRVFSLMEEDGPRGKRTCFDEVKELIGWGKSPVRVISAGGDGTIKWVVSEAQKYGVDPGTSLLIGVLPLGTGNDFSRYSGWGGKFPGNLLSGDLENLEHLVRKWCSARAGPHDVWKVRISVDEERGAISKVNKRRTRSYNEETSVEETMIMYFDIGQGSKIGMGFDQRRTTNRLCNNCVYLWEGFKKLLPCRRRHLVANVTDGLYQGTDANGDLIFDTNPDSDGPKLKSKPQILLFINIPSYSGGRADPWRGATRLGVTRPLDPDIKKLVQDPGDGKLEVVTIRNPPAVVLDKVIQKLSFLGARRVFSGAPYFLAFATSEENDVLSYCQVDGEFFKLINPIEVVVKPSLHIQVLYNDNPMDDSSSSSSDESSSEEEPRDCLFSFRRMFGAREPSYSSLSKNNM